MRLKVPIQGFTFSLLCSRPYKSVYFLKNVGFVISHLQDFRHGVHCHQQNLFLSVCFSIVKKENVGNRMKGLPMDGQIAVVLNRTAVLDGNVSC